MDFRSRLPTRKKEISQFFFLLLLFVFIKVGQTPFLILKLGIFGKKVFKVTPKLTRFRLSLTLVLFLLAFYSFLVAKFIIQLPSPYKLNVRERPLTTQILDRQGRVLYQIYEGQNRKLVSLDELPPSLIWATIAIEDQHFLSHPGVDPLGILRALKIDLVKNETQGGSTITQQLIKNTLLTPERTFSRKLKEVILAFWVEQIYNKKEILQMYFNEAPYGGPAWGIEAASEMYFGKQAKDLNLTESSYLAGLPVSPTEYSPYGTHPEKGEIRQKEVLRRMVEDGYITQAQAQKALEQKLKFQPPLIDIKAPHFVMYIRSLLASKYGERTVAQGGLKVKTTLDLNIQEMAEAIVAEQVGKLSPLRVTNGAAMVTDAKNGQILAMVGSKNYFDDNQGNFNVTLGLRQPGSAIKVVTYATAFKEGFGPGNILLDTPTTFPNPWGKPYSPVNYDGAFHGPVTIRTALGSSYNVPAVKMLGTVGLPKMLKTAKDMGITTLNKTEDYGLSLTLGGGEVRMVEMMSVYGTLASLGVNFPPQAILEVWDSYGNLLDNHQEAEGKRVLTEEVTYLLTNILTDNNARTPAFGPNSLLKIDGYEVAVKTGTSDNKRDNWAFGFTPEFVVGAWVGNNDNSPMDPRLTSGITGAAPIWHDLMSNLLVNHPKVAFKQPRGVIEITADGHRDLGIAGQAPKTVIGYQKVKQKDEVTGSEKEVITFTDPFSAYLPQKSPTSQ